MEASVFSLNHRVTYERIFSNHLTTFNIDLFILLGAGLSWFFFTLRSRTVRIITTILLLTALILVFLDMLQIPIIIGTLLLPAVVTLIFINRWMNNKILLIDSNLTLNYIAAISGLIAFLAILDLAYFSFIGISPKTNDKIGYGIYQELLGIMTPILMGILVLCLPVKVVLISIKDNIRRFFDPVLIPISNDRITNKAILVSISTIIILGLAFVVVPHLSNLNPYGERIGVDTPRYVLWLTKMNNQTSNPIQIAFRDLSSGDRPLTLIILFVITENFKVDPTRVVEYSPLFLSPLLILATFFLTRQLTSNDRISIIAAFLTAISFQALVGIYSGFYANWLALVFGYFALTLILRFLERGSKFLIPLILLTIISSLLSHTYTWSIIIGVAFILLLVLQSTKRYKKSRFVILYLVLFSSVVIDISKAIFIGGSIGFESDLNVGVSHGFGISQFSDRLKTLADIVQTYYGGIMSNVSILGLGVYWLIRSRISELSSIFMIIFFSSALIPLFLGDWVFQSRVLYEIPFQIPAAIALFFIWKENHKIVAVAILIIAFYLSFHVLVNLGLNYSVVG